MIPRRFDSKYKVYLAVGSPNWGFCPGIYLDNDEPNPNNEIPTPEPT